MLATEIFKGAGLGNQLFFYVVLRCIAMDRGLPWGLKTPEYFANNMHSTCGLYFMDLDMGEEISQEQMDELVVYAEQEVRLYLGNSRHDLTHGCYVSPADLQMMDVADGSMLLGNMQAEEYFWHHQADIKQWLAVKQEYECFDYSKEDLCIMHIRCTDYANNPELYLRKKYWVQGMKRMREHNPKMQFMIITNDVEVAGRLLPGIPAYNFDLAKDYSIIKNARNLILSNSSFTLFPVFTSEQNPYVIAPKYWARHNVSDGYWASEQNIYSLLTYMDRKGKIFTAQECRQELAEYKKKASYEKRKKRPKGFALLAAECKLLGIRTRFWTERIGRSLWKRLRKVLA